MPKSSWIMSFAAYPEVSGAKKALVMLYIIFILNNKCEYI